MYAQKTIWSQHEITATNNQLLIIFTTCCVYKLPTPPAHPIRNRITVSISACHADDQGSIPCCGELFCVSRRRICPKHSLFLFIVNYYFISFLLYFFLLLSTAEKFAHHLNTIIFLVYNKSDLTNF